MIPEHKLREIYERGALLSHTAGLEAVWDAAQLDILKAEPGDDDHPDVHPVKLDVPDRRAKATLAVTHHHGGHHHAQR